MSFAGKPPPRYVPTLTEVVTEPEARAEPTAIAPETMPHRGDRLPEPQDVFAPQLEREAEAEAEPEPEPKPEPEPEPEPVPPSEVAPALAPAWVAPAAQRDDQAWLRAEELLVQRLLERVDQVLDQRLRETIAQVVQAQTRSLTLRLQEELESVVRQTVQEAVAQERAGNPR